LPNLPAIYLRPLKVLSVRGEQLLAAADWFLRDFGYDTELVGRDEIDEKQLVSLKGVVKIRHIDLNGASL
jgi:hypothetical protein